MRIGYDATSLSAPRSGVGTYTWNLLHHLSMDTGDEITLLTNRASGHLPMLNKTLWMQMVLPWQLARMDPDVCHFTNSVAPLWTPCPMVVTIHDMTLWLTPEHHYGRRLAAMRPLIPIVARRATMIIAVSQNTKNDILRILRVPESKVRVVHEAPAVHFQPMPYDVALQAVMQRCILPERFILYVGTIEPRKNLVRLVEAFARLLKRGMTSHDLVLVGQRGWKTDPVFATIERLGVQKAVHVLGYVSEMDLVAIYNLAAALVFPSLYEGFGLPVIEAMASGTPVVTSARGSLSEVAGDAAQFVDPSDVESIAEGIRRVLADADWREELRVRGLAQARRFTWTDAAAQTRQVYRQCLLRGAARLSPSAVGR